MSRGRSRGTGPAFAPRRPRLRPSYAADMTELRTTPNDADVEAFLAGIEHEQRREDARAVSSMMREITQLEPVMWGDSIIGFGAYRYRRANGQEYEWFAVGVSPRKKNLTIYIMDGFDAYGELLARLGKHSTAKSCLYITRLDNVDGDVLRELVTRSFRHTQSSGDPR
jgi:Domain of unknown function (DU1801)